MPMHGSECMPKFDGKASSLLKFLNQYEVLADDGGLQGQDHIKQLLCYLPSDERELWSGLTEAKASDFDVFVAEVKVMYPGCEGDRCYALSDLQVIVRKYVSMPMPSVEGLSAYYCAFHKVMQPLLASNRIGTAER
ncbi:hypothetical protein BDR05DRAFT_861371, partial [Suillus weaverae]